MFSLSDTRAARSFLQNPGCICASLSASSNTCEPGRPATPRRRQRSVLPEATSDGVWSGERDVGRRSSSPPGVRWHSTPGVQATLRASRPSGFSFPLEAGKEEMMVLRCFFFFVQTAGCACNGAPSAEVAKTSSPALACPARYRRTVPACIPVGWASGSRERAAGIRRVGIRGRRIGRAFREGGV